jgi:hypothetical protein
MANAKQKIDRWSSSENTLLSITQPRNSQTLTTDLSVQPSMSATDGSSNDQ